MTAPAAPLRVLVTDPIISRFAAVLDAGGHETVLAPGRPDEEVAAALPGTDVLVCSRMTEPMARAATGLRLVQVTGAGYERIAVGALAPGVAVANTFHHGPSIAEHVVMVALMLSRRVLRKDRLLREGVWESVTTDPDLPLGTTLAGRTLGLVGLGETGGRVARLAAALGMRVQAVRRDPAAPLADGPRLDRVLPPGDLPELLETSDVVVVTVPLTDRTRGLIGAAELRRMRRTAFLINVARGPVVDERALYEALAEDRIAGAGIDVWWPDPGGTGRAGSTMPFERLGNVVLTPHNSGHTRETFENRARDIAANIAALAEGRPLRNVVHPG
ncbi:2-hydroxyacid dehydrogenase [Actinomadura viridis]|uniref:Phosphoglycerate dehydrogenase-like enzyme n=1 Tax=Actinomadura viridis TaxID=58110 RepID=A0A931DTV4_9ACTN|nr:2-hydroxyacid dehydrogenase [Actinomadura viridis]MBG6093796.1 phosphoglycerate dehydrogenase-like enzyme [Actinomadura viridis]